MRDSLCRPVRVAIPDCGRRVSDRYYIERQYVRYLYGSNPKIGLCPGCSLLNQELGKPRHPNPRHLPKHLTLTSMKAAILLSILITVSGAQSSSENMSAQEIQVGVTWTDPSTSLMWAGEDNGKDVSWKNAVKYCRDLGLTGHSDWRLPAIDELQGIYDASGIVAPKRREGIEWALAGRPKGSLVLTGNHHWSSTTGKDDRGHSTGYAWYFDFPDGRRDWDPYDYHGSKRALCVRRSGE